MLFLISLKQDLPAGAERGTPLPNALGETVIRFIRNKKGLIFRPAIESLGLADLIGAQRVAVRGRGVLLGRRSVADHAVDDDQRRLAFVGTKTLQGTRDADRVVGVANVQHVPAIAAKPLLDAFAEREIGVALDRDGVAVVDP